jgi:fluoride exporter
MDTVMSALQFPVMLPSLAGLGLVALGGAVGAVARYHVAAAIERRLGAGMPWGTLVVNLSAALLAGGLLALFNLGRLPVPAGWLLLIVGLLGSYSTVSSFSIQTLVLARQHGYHALLYAALSVTGCLVLVATGYLLGGWLGG